MVVALGPGRFYGRNLPRPRFYPDPKLNPTRIDPPESVSDPLLSWANEAHWSMGGLSFRRLRLQGSIEGNISKLRGSVSDKKPRFTKDRLDALDESEEEEEEEVEVKEEMVEDEESGGEESDEDVVVVSKKRKRARRLGDEFDKIAERVKGVEKGDKKVNNKENKKGNKKDLSKETNKGIKKENSKGNSEENKKGKAGIVRRISPRGKQN